LIDRNTSFNGLSSVFGKQGSDGLGHGSRHGGCVRKRGEATVCE
jgi:hypothetical protein